VTFFGGTALARSLLPDGRLSEDIDLIAKAHAATRPSTCTPPCASPPPRVPRPALEPALTRYARRAAVLHSSEGLTVRVQLLSPVGYPPWPVHSVALIQRYSDAHQPD